MLIMYGEILRQTQKALELKFEDRRVWIPLSQILKEDLPWSIIEIPDWLAKAKGLEKYRVRQTATGIRHRGTESRPLAGAPGNRAA